MENIKEILNNLTNIKFSWLLAWGLMFFTISLSSSDSLDNYDIKLSLDKSEYFEGQEIILRIEFDINKGDSTIYFTPDILKFDLLLTDSENNKYRYKYYLMSLTHTDTVDGSIVHASGRMIFPIDSIAPKHKKVMVAELCKDFTLEEGYWGRNLNITEYLKPANYAIGFEAVRSYDLFKRWPKANTLTFKILKRNK